MPGHTLLHLAAPHLALLCFPLPPLSHGQTFPPDPWPDISPRLLVGQTGFELPARIKIYVLDFLSATKSKSFLEQHDGFMASKA